MTLDHEDHRHRHRERCENENESEETDHQSHAKPLAIVAGNNLRGKVIFELPEELDPQQMIGVSITLHGKERTEVKRPNGNVDTAERTLILSQLVLREEGKGVERSGTYGLPFEFHLPASLPSSMHSTHSTELVYASHADIKYTLGVTLGSEVVFTRVFVVASAPLPNVVIPALAKPAFHEIKGMATSKGELLLGAKVASAYVGRLQGVEVYISSRNVSSTNVERCEVRLIETVKWTAEKMTFNPLKLRKKDEIQWKQEKRVLAKDDNVNVRGVEKAKMDQSGNMNISRDEKIYQIYDDLLSEDNKVELLVPYEARDTYAGQLIKTEHVVVITLWTKMGVDNPSIEIPIQVGFPPHAAWYDPHLGSMPGDELFNLLPEEPSPRTAMLAAATFSDGSSRRSRLSIAAIPDAQLPSAEARNIPDEEDIQIIELEPSRQASTRLGGSAIYLMQDSQRVLDIENEETTYDETQAPPSIQGLFDEMVISLNDFEMISQKLRDPLWVAVLSSISPEDFGNIVALVKSDYDQGKVAAMIAACCLVPQGFTCEYCIGK